MSLNEQMQIFLEKWQPYIEVDDFDSLTELVSNTINGVKMNKMYVLYNKDDEKERYFMEDLKKFIKISYMSSHQPSHNPSTYTSCEMIDIATSQLCVINYLEDVTNYGNIKQALSDDTIMLRRLYQPAEEVKFSCNVLGITSKMPFTNNETIIHRSKIIRIKSDNINA
jgi:hypothetical protein